jgi:hypothetical protein
MEQRFPISHALIAQFRDTERNINKRLSPCPVVQFVQSILEYRSHSILDCFESTGHAPLNKPADFDSVHRDDCIDDPGADVSTFLTSRHVMNESTFAHRGFSKLHHFLPRVIVRVDLFTTRIFSQSSFNPATSMSLIS